MYLKIKGIALPTASATGFGRVQIFDANKNAITIPYSNLVSHDMTKNITADSLTSWMNGVKPTTIPYTDKNTIEFIFNLPKNDNQYTINLYNWINSSAIVSYAEIYVSSDNSNYTFMGKYYLDNTVDSLTAVTITLRNLKMILNNKTTGKLYSIVNDTLIHLPNSSTMLMNKFGIDTANMVQLNIPFTKHMYVKDNGDFTEDIVAAFSVYDFISDLPEVLVLPDNTEDVTILTTTKSFDLYDIFVDDMDVLCYFEDSAVAKANLIADMNRSPLDDLDGDFELATWTDDTVNKSFEMVATPQPQFIYSSTIQDVSNGISGITNKDYSVDNKNLRFLFTQDNTRWYTWKLGNFVSFDLLNDDILLDGMTSSIMNSLTQDDFNRWTQPKINVGVFLCDSIRRDNHARASKLTVDATINTGTSSVADAKFYILNTTAKINIDFTGLTLIGQVSDDDMTRVQYRVKLNGKSYYPADGSFTPLSNPPLNIDITLKSNEIKVGDWNTLEVEFQDYFGSTDKWSTTFIGKYAGLMFMDTAGKYYSTDLGAVLQYLDFGTVIAGQITPSYEVKIKNEYGFDVKNAKISINESKFAQGLHVELAANNNSFNGSNELNIGNIRNNTETTFFIRMVSSINTVPNNDHDFNIVVTAERVI